MCGLVAIIERHAAVNWPLLSASLAKIRHRGPDGEGFAGIGHDGALTEFGADNTRIGLGFCRLSILDLSGTADQPMRHASTSNVITFNGEIYNFLELRAELETLGHSFRTQGDTEVILAAYAQWGEGAFAKLNGMWAIVLYDAATGDTLISRDRMGVKPLYYSSNGARQVFASEIRAVLSMMEMPVSINPAVAFDFLAGAEIDNCDETLFAGIVAVPAGGLWRINRAGEVTRGHYHVWDNTIVPETSGEALRALLNDSVRLRLRSDAPTVSLLSGGLDSSVITWLAATSGQHDPRTKFIGAFSYGYTSDAYAEHDEIARAQALVAALPEKIDHTIERMDPVPSIDELLAMTATQEMPVNTPSTIASWRLYQAIRAQGIKVVISGEGADELFGGYTRRYMPMRVRDMLFRGEWLGAWQLLRSPYVTLKGVARALSWHLPQAVMVRLLRRYRPNLALLSPSLWKAQSRRFAHIMEHHRMPLEQLFKRSLTEIEMPQILRYADRNSMHASVEVRLPFMDYRLVQYARSLVVGAKVNVGGGKQPLRNAFKNILPDAIVAQPKTHGFGNAEQYQVLKMQLQPLIERAPEVAWNYVDKAAFARALRAENAHPLIWLPVSFLLWTTAWHEQRI